jgi:hypothetical protein
VVGIHEYQDLVDALPAQTSPPTPKTFRKCKVWPDRRVMVVCGNAGGAP